jgi:hypothetical protein
VSIENGSNYILAVAIPKIGSFEFSKIYVSKNK